MFLHDVSGCLVEFRTGNNYLSAFYSYCSQAKGLGYAINTSEELKFVKEIATATGVVLDPVYRYGTPILLYDQQYWSFSCHRFLLPICQALNHLIC